MLREQLKELTRGVAEEDKSTFRLLIQLQSDVQKAQADIAGLDRKIDHKVGNIKQVQQGFDQRLTDISANLVTTPIHVGEAPDPNYTAALVDESKARKDLTVTQKGFWVALTALVMGAGAWIASLFKGG